jgi:hypothetical protein
MRPPVKRYFDPSQQYKTIEITSTAHHREPFEEKKIESAISTIIRLRKSNGLGLDAV